MGYHLLNIKIYKVCTTIYFSLFELQKVNFSKVIFSSKVTSILLHFHHRQMTVTISKETAHSPDEIKEKMVVLKSKYFDAIKLWSNQI
jgi:hypothetical protein